jgi:putative membrane protein
MLAVLDLIVADGNRTIKIVIKILLVLLILIFQFGAIFSLRGIISGYGWIFTAYCILLAAVSFLHLISITDKFSSILFTLAVFILSVVAETCNIRSSMPFGERLFYDSMQPFLFGTAPLFMPFFWITVSINSFLICRFIYLKTKNNYAVPLCSALIIVSYDILLEPFGSFINKYWIWNNNFVPVINFVSWFVIGFMFTYMPQKTVKFIPTNIENRRMTVPIIVFTLLALQFAVVNYANGFWLYTTVALLLIIAVCRTLRKYVIQKKLF